MKAFRVIFLFFLLKLQSFHGASALLTAAEIDDTVYGLSIAFFIICIVIFVGVLILLYKTIKRLRSENEEKSHHFKHGTYEMYINKSPYYGASSYKSKESFQIKFQGLHYEDVKYNRREDNVESFQNDAYVKSQ